ncbi:hemerythrin domain-containing protein, partial [bacterium]|nr:hemerythrin domain-containing protein [bacterium]
FLVFLFKVTTRGKRMLEISNKLMKEHQLILKFIELSMRYADNPKCCELFLEKGPQFVQFIREYADDYHHAKEEQVLFRTLEESGTLVHCNPVGQMLHEHTMARQLVKQMENACLSSDIEVLRESTRNYGLLLRDHIFKEDNILYPMAEDLLSNENKKAISKQYQELENEIEGQSLERKYEDLLIDLENALI